jgi:hypothetical protein
MPKKLLLNCDYDKDFTLIGIVSHQRDYRLVWSINEKMNLHLVKMNDMRIFQDKKNEMNAISFYYDEIPETFKIYYFISNTGSNGPLFPEHKQTNFFLLIKGNVSQSLKESIIHDLFTNEYVLKAYSIQLSSIKNIENFFSDMELELMDMFRSKKVHAPNPK